METGGQILHNNPVGAPLPDYVCALVSHIRDELARAYWNTQQKQWEASRDFDWWDDRKSEHGLTPLPPGIEWRHYYNWDWCPEDPDWDQSQADAPNFAFEGVEIRWYKRFGRSMNANVVWEPQKWVRWFERCAQTIESWEQSNCVAFSHGDSIPIPSPDGKVPLAPSPEDFRYVELMEKLQRAEAQLTLAACVCIAVSRGENTTYDEQDWRWCHTVEWVQRLGAHALTAPTKFELHAQGLDERKEVIIGVRQADNHLAAAYFGHPLVSP